MWVFVRGCIHVISCGEETKARNAQLVTSISISFNCIAAMDAAMCVSGANAKENIAE